MFEYFAKGGLVMIPIAGCSILALTICIERFWMLRRKKVFTPGLAQQVEDLLRKGNLEAAMAACRHHETPLARLILVALKNAGQSRDVVKEAVQEVGRREAAHLERYVGALGTISNVSTLLGLLGTVSGMIKSFSVIAAQGMGTPALLAGGISEALVATAAGLATAIPSFLAYRYFLSRVDHSVLDLEHISLHFVDMVKQSVRRPAPPPQQAVPAARVG